MSPRKIFLFNCRFRQVLDLTKYDLSSLKKVLFNGSTVNREIHANLIELLPDTSIIQVYSLTETGVIAYQRETGKIGSSGYVGRNVRLMITSLYPSAKIIPLGPNKNGRELGLRLEILGYYDTNGNIFIGQVNQIFKCKNKIISPAEIEAVLQNHPMVLEAVVVPVPHNLEDEYPKAFVTKVPRKEVSEEELQQWVIEKLRPDKKLCGSIIFLSRMPRISNGNIQRKIFNY
ncbi:4-coumarate--CoA ligase-like 2 [Monomorium pharaonis]|uniref:4-coumarate--CoA ligase-like 2 n=1 Tax=Monomorium pharaonis TaxID=307658 RepID=UPI00063FB625|nr:4-coumarate--CoA ligase-like 2 [Monomorium pharaonis]